MKLLITLVALLLTGCVSLVPAPLPKWPDAPNELTEKCPPLNTLPVDTPLITDLLKTVVKNYELYYFCSLKQEGWTDWYKLHKKNYEEVIKK